MERQRDEKIERWKDRQMERLRDGNLDKWKYSQMDGQID